MTRRRRRSLYEPLTAHDKKRLMDAVDRRTEKLADEWLGFLAELEERRSRKKPGLIPIDPEKMRAKYFEHWVMTKLAGLQLVIEHCQLSLAEADLLSPAEIDG
ncbi:MAG: hypothetical protein AB7O68_19990 [Pirellulales bacterium]